MASLSSEEDSRSSGDDRLGDTLRAADRLLEVAEHGVANVGDLDPDPDPGDKWSSPKVEKLSSGRSLEQRLLELHIEESKKALASAGLGKS